MSNPWMKFYPSDWRADQTLRICSLAARGLWIECMCIMHEAEPYGHLAIKGKPVTNAQLAILSGTDPATVATLLTELEEAGVFSKNRVGVIYSRRMTRDEKKRKDGEKSAKNGTLPNSRRGKQVVEKKEEKLPPTGPADRVVEGVACKPPSTQKPEARNYTDTEAKASGAIAASEPQVSQAVVIDLFPAEEHTPAQMMWGTYLHELADMTGKSTKDPSLRKLLGQWSKAYGGEQAVCEAISDASARQPPLADPVPWIIATLKTRKNGNERNRPQKRNSGWFEFGCELAQGGIG
jgi:hypothetical protein